MKPKQIGKFLKTSFFATIILAEIFAFGALPALAAAPVADIDNHSPVIGSKVVVSITPTGKWTGQIFVNGAGNALPMPGSPYNLTISADNGFNVNAPNSIEVRIFDTTGAQVGDTLIPQINVKSSAATPVTPTTGMSKNPTDKLINPIPGFDNITDLLINIMKAFMAIVAVWAVAFIVIGGFRMVISQGNEEAVTAAKKTILWAVLGVVVAALSFAIIAIVQNFVGVDVQKPVTTFNSTPPKV